MQLRRTTHRASIVVSLATSLLVLSPIRAQDTTPTTRLTISTERLAQKPISKIIFGQFIESGFGRQTDGMWSEMIFNRSFQRPYSSFNRNTWEWLMLGPEFYNTKAPFWHSGYEQCDWETIDSHTTLSRTLGVQTYKGLSSLRMDYDGKGSHGGIRQKGLYLKDGKGYHLSLFGGFTGRAPSGASRNLQIVLRSEADPNRIVFGQTVELASSQQPFDLAVRPQGFTGRATLEFVFPWQGSVFLSWCSMMPDDNVRGWNREVVEGLKRIAPGIIRYPGGCFASFYDWKNMVGPRAQRPVVESFYWGGLEENDVGIDEFLDLCHELQCEPQICVNMMSSTPFKAMEMVQYCNGPDDSHLGQLRVGFGVHRRNRVTYWEMDNEASRKWTAEQYAEQIVQFATTMRQADPQIRIMMECYSYDRSGRTGTLARMLEIAGQHANLVITRASDPASLQSLLEVIRAYNAAHHEDVLLCNTEWLATGGDAPEPFADPEIPQRFGWRGGQQLTDYRQVLSFRQIHWFYALNVGKILTQFLAHGGELNHTNFNNCCNTWGQNVIESAKEGAWLSAAGRVFEFMKNRDLAYPLRTELSADVGVYVTAQACSTENGDLVVFVVNQGTKSVPATISVPAGYRPGVVETLFARDRLSRARPGNDEIQTERGARAGTSLTLRPLSITKLRLQRNG